MVKLTKETIVIPLSMRGRPIHNGYLVPFFVAWFKSDQQVPEGTPDAKPSFPTTDATKMVACRKQKLCWICGHKLGAYKVFVFGPASALVGASYEPPSHIDCARYAVRVCPYMLNPNAVSVTQRGGYKMKEGESVIDEIAPSNAGVSVIWSTKSYEFMMKDPSRGVGLFMLGKPELVEFWSEGKPSTYKQAVDAFNKSLHINGWIDPSQPIQTRKMAWKVSELLEWVQP